MFGNLLIGLREGLEAATIIAIIVAYLVKVDARSGLPRVWAGVAGAIALSLGFAGFLTLTSRELADTAEETFAGTTSFAAVALVTWMIFWMAKHSRSLAGRLRGEVDRALGAGPWALAVVAFVAVIREGIETSLFLWTGVRSTGADTNPAIGALLGLAIAAAIGVLIYRGALRLNLAKVFTWTGYALIIVAAGILRYGVHEFQEAGLLPDSEVHAYDVSAIVPIDSWYGTLLKGAINFSTSPTWLEVGIWITYVSITLVAYRNALGRRVPEAVESRA